MLVDLRPFKVTGKAAEVSLCNANILVTKMVFLLTQRKWLSLQELALDLQAATTRGFGLNEFKKIGELITKVVKGLSQNPNDNKKIESEVRKVSWSLF